MSVDPRQVEPLLSACGPDGDAEEALVLADLFMERDALRLAAAALDRAFGLRPDDTQIQRQRQEVLERLAVTEYGLRFCYVPAGTFLMGSEAGEPDESPAHPVRLEGFWIAEVPTTWSAYCDLMGFQPPPSGFPPGEWNEWKEEEATLCAEHRICMQYCETSTRRAEDWHVHMPEGAEAFGSPDRAQPHRPYAYDEKPVVAVSWRGADTLGRRISTGIARYGLPSEAQWERAARGGLICARYPWGNASPTPGQCDCDRFGELSIRPPRSLAPNGYGLHGMCGGVWEWTADRYDALAYQAERPALPKEDDELQRAVRGGSWADTSEVCTVSFRHSRRQTDDGAPNTGFRLCRMESRDDGA
jgi:sulfatase modifying factor 1